MPHIIAALCIILTGSVAAPAGHAREAGRTSGQYVPSAGPGSRVVLGPGQHYIPEIVEVEQGGSIQFTNLDAFSGPGHSLVDVDHTARRFGTTITETTTTSEVNGVSRLTRGRYPFHCVVHTHVVGTLVVR